MTRHRPRMTARRYAVATVPMVNRGEYRLVEARNPREAIQRLASLEAVPRDRVHRFPNLDEGVSP